MFFRFPWFFLHYSVTRRKLAWYRSLGIKECFIAIEPNLPADTLNWLENTSNNPMPFNPRPKKNNVHAVQPIQDIQAGQAFPAKPIVTRRGSVIGGGLYAVDGGIEEHGFDYLNRIPLGPID